MLIVCPNCSTSYSVDQGSLGPAGRTVRCARCKSTWFAGGAKETAEPDLDAFVDRAIAQVQAQPAQSTEMPPSAGDAEPSAGLSEPARAESNHHTERSDSPAEAKLPESAALDGGGEFQFGEPPVPITDAPSLVPPLESEPLQDAAPAEGIEAEQEDIESFAARRERLQVKRKQTLSRSRWTALILLLAAFNVALVGARDDVVRYLPQTASLFAMIRLPVNLRHLAFKDVKVSRETTDGIPVLLIEGKIVSKSEKPIAVPRLRFAARSTRGQELYTWTALPSRGILGPGESLPFKSRLASPPKDAADIMVRFFSSRDRTAAIK